jgi:hypothetical protein
VAIVLMSLTAAFTLLGGAGTTCVAINPIGFGGSFARIAPFQWLYVLFVIVTIAFGAMSGRALFLLLGGRSNAFRYALIALVGGIIVGVIHMLVSRSLRGSSMPVDMVVGVNILTLVVFLLLYFTGLWKPIAEDLYHRSNPAGRAGGLAAITMGSICLTIQHWMAATHTIGGINYADIWHVQFQLLGWVLVVCGMLGMLWGMGLLKRKNLTRITKGVAG